MSERSNTSPMCEECDIPMHPYNYGDISGFACNGCGWNEETGTDPEPDPQTHIEISPPSITSIDVEELKHRNLVFETLMHKIQLYHDVTTDKDGLHKLLVAISNWSYAHRIGNGGMSETKQKELIDKAFTALAKLVLE